MASTVVSKSLGWCLFCIGIVGAVIGIAELRVELVVFCLIVASTSGLILLKMRAEAHGRLDGIETLEPRRAPSAMV